MIFARQDEDGTEIEIEVNYIYPYCDGFGLVPFHITFDGYIVYNYCKMCDDAGTINNNLTYLLIYPKGDRLQ